MRKALGEKGSREKERGSSPAIRPLAAKKKKKKTIVQALQIVSPAPNLSSSFSDSTSNQPDNPATEPKATSSFLLLETFCLRSGPSQSQPNFVGLRVVHKPEEERDIDYYQKVLFCRPNYNGFKHL